MSFSQTKNQNESKILLTQITLKEPVVLNGYHYNFKVPEELMDEYKLAIHKYGSFYKELSDLFHELYPTPPYSANHFVDFIVNNIGVAISIKGFTNNTEIDLDGRWEWNNVIERKAVTIWVEDRLNEGAKKMTIIHECFHIIQDLDTDFITMLSTQHPLIQRIIADRIAEKSAVETVLPRDEYNHCRREKRTHSYIADKYRVSMTLVNNFRV